MSNDVKMKHIITLFFYNGNEKKKYKGKLIAASSPSTTVFPSSTGSIDLFSSTSSESCSNHGRLVEGLCECERGFEGQECERGKWRDLLILDGNELSNWG